MSTEDYSSDLEVVSKDMASAHMNDSVDSKFASPEDSPRAKHNAMAEMDGSQPSDVERDTVVMNGDSSVSIAAVVNGTSNAEHGNTISPEDASADPMLASALSSPLYDPLNIDAMFTNNKKPGIQRAPTILQRAHTVGNDWELYKRAGPRYPASLEQLIMKYHQKHSDSWQLAHDLGAGSGVYAPTLARFFRHVHVSDPTTTGIEASRKTISKWNHENPKKRGRFTFSVGKPEAAQECAADGSVDMAVLMESAHFTDAEAVVRSVAETLAPGGTLAIVTHRPVSQVVGNEKVAEAVERLFDAWGKQPWEVACGTTARAQQQYSLGLDFVPLPTDLFKQEETRRITINSHGKPRDFFRVPGVDDNSDDKELNMSTDEMFDMPSTRVSEKEKQIEYGEEDEQGRGWRFEIGWESFRTRIALLDRPETVARLEPHLKEIQELIMKTSPNGVKVVIEWAVSVILASRR